MCIFSTTSTILSKVKPSFTCTIYVVIYHIYFKTFWYLPDLSQEVVRQHLGIPIMGVFLVNTIKKSKDFLSQDKDLLQNNMTLPVIELGQGAIAFVLIAGNLISLKTIVESPAKAGRNGQRTHSAQHLKQNRDYLQLMAM